MRELYGEIVITRAMELDVYYKATLESGKRCQKDIGTESKLALLTARQANGSQRRGVEARKTTLLESQLTEKMAG